jgi:tRNA-5-methyluridine54 2-sulfurtransferase
MRCRRCGAKAVIKMPRHNTAFCGPCLDHYVMSQVKRAIRDHSMFAHADRILVAVSGGKDSLVLWDVLSRLGFETAGLHIQQGIGDYSDRSHRATEAFAEARRLPLILHSLQENEGAGVLEMSELSHRSACSACGVVKRYQFNKIALDQGYDILATGHNLDDEAARLMGNLLHWQDEYLSKQSPSLPRTQPNLVKKVKPLYRLTEREISAYAVLRRIEYEIEECPMSAGSKMLAYKDALNRLEAASPGTKQYFYLGFLERQQPEAIARTDEKLVECQRCRQPTTAELCSYCRLMDRVTAAYETL